ncbi:MAG: DEAD/DEAH box helicase [Clostridia bacterium]|nr:DEAD/DEAH box helicase [Clostridia bacterium]
MEFSQLHLNKQLLAAVRCCGYAEPTPIQRETIPPVLLGRDVLGCAQTGTGKTAAFALPILQRLFEEGKPEGKKRPIRALILTPTRELALQIYENFEGYGKNLPLRPCVIFGGVGQQPQVEQLRRGVDILVATPGRLNDLIGQGHITLDRLEVFVLDEADRMLDMGFIHDVKKVIAKLPQKRQTLFFSATMPTEVEKLAQSLLTDPVTVKVNPVSSTVDRIDQILYMVDKTNKKHLLAKLLKDKSVENALVFSRTKHGADRIVRELSRAGIEARSIHGNKSQSARQQALGDFKSGKVRVLVATDIAARGIDIAGLSHVFNYDLPNEPEAYVHRIGRTGRAGLDGTAISFCCIDEMKELRQIEKLTGKAIPRKESEWPMEVFTETVKQPRPQRSAPEKAAVTPVSKTPECPAAKPAATKATPLERPVQPAPKKAVQKPEPRAQRAAQQHERSYADMIRRSRSGRKPLSTGNDRV